MRSFRGCLSLGVIILLGVALSTQSFGLEKYRVVIVPKLVGISYYDAVKRGIDQAAQELPDLQVTWSGPSQDRVEKQIELLEDAIRQRPQLIAVAANDPVAIVPVLKKASQAGIHVISWDGDADFREFFVNLVDYKEFAAKIVDLVAEGIAGEGEIAMITTTFAAQNQLRWIGEVKSLLYAKYPKVRILDIRAAGENTVEAYRITQDYLSSFPQLKGIIAFGAPNLPGVAMAVRDAGLAGRIAVVGNSTPNLMRPYLKDGTVRKVVLWNAVDHGYLTVHVAHQLLTGALEQGRAFSAGRLGPFVPKADRTSLEVALPILVFDRDNVDQYDF
jgi:ABC-type sugar transport system substrate-binding protein